MKSVSCFALLCLLLSFAQGGRAHVDDTLEEFARTLSDTSIVAERTPVARQLDQLVSKHNSFDVLGHPDYTISLCAAWQRLVNTIEEQSSEGVQSCNNTNWFIGFVQGRTGLCVPVQWQTRVLGVSFSQFGIPFFPLPERIDSQATAHETRLQGLRVRADTLEGEIVHLLPRRSKNEGEGTELELRVPSEIFDQWLSSCAIGGKGDVYSLSVSAELVILTLTSLQLDGRHSYILCFVDEDSDDSVASFRWCQEVDALWCSVVVATSNVAFGNTAVSISHDRTTVGVFSSFEHAIGLDVFDVNSGKRQYSFNTIPRFSGLKHGEGLQR